MTKARKQTQKAVAAIMAAIGKTQRQLAKDIGASESTVKSWTRKKNPLRISSDFKARIYAAYGAFIDDSGNLFAFVNGAKKEFTKESFVRWREYMTKTSRPYYSGRSPVTSYFVARAGEVIGRIFWAATEKENGRADKCFAVVECFNQWAQNTIKDFRLSKSKLFTSPRYLAIMKSVIP
jgi:transcriptional regulator with XRE-family HTH domain